VIPPSIQTSPAQKESRFRVTEQQAPPPVPSTPSTPSSGIETNVASALAYLPIIAIVWLVLEPYSKDKTIRFHAIQSLGLAVTWFGLSIILTVIPILGWILLILLSPAVFVVAVICAVKAYQNQKFKLPIIGDFAEKQV
jgi:uncharacterized membrane protein